MCHEWADHSELMKIVHVTLLDNWFSSLALSLLSATLQERPFGSDSLLLCTTTKLVIELCCSIISSSSQLKQLSFV